MNYEVFTAFIRDDVDYLNQYYKNNKITFTDFMLALNNEFTKYSIKNNHRENLTSLIISKYLNNDLSSEDRVLAEDKLIYSLTKINLGSLKNDKEIKKVLSCYHNELTEYIYQNMHDINNSYLDNLKLVLSEIIPHKKQRKLSSSIRCFPEDMLELRCTELKKFFNDKKKMEILDTDLILQVYHLHYSQDIDKDFYTELINKAKKIRNEFGKIKVEEQLLSPLLFLINQDIVYADFHNKITSHASTELWSHIQKFSLNNIKNINVTDKKFLFVLTKNNELVIAPHKQGKIYLRHIMLSDGQSILTGGDIEFSEDMTKVISINNGTGHYKASFESLNLIKEHLKNSDYDTSNTILIDIVSERTEKLFKTNYIRKKN